MYACVHVDVGVEMGVDVCVYWEQGMLEAPWCRTHVWKDCDRE